MSYILYINGKEIELGKLSDIAQTKQVNDLATLDNRQSNFTHKFTAPPTAKNIKAMAAVYLVGNQSNIPYQKNESTLFDAESSACLIYKGWAVVKQSGIKGYEITITDGIIDFYRAIENKSLTDIGISDLNHAKNLETIVQSWEDNLPYYYAVADYNGNNAISTALSVQVNTDFQIPSARISYLWERVHLFAGYTYSGSYFLTDDFLNWFISFPKPVPSLVPIVEPITNQDSVITTSLIQNGDFSFSTLYHVNLIPLSIVDTTMTKPANSPTITIIQDGTYRVKCTGGFSPTTIIEYRIIYPIANPLIPDLVGVINGEIILSLFAGEKLSISSSGSGFVPITGSVTTFIDLITGYDANFEEAFVDFSVTDFVKEIMQDAGLTAFKNKYTNHIEYLKLDEILQSETPEDWTKKFQYKDIEKYRVGKYAKRNNFKYRYNSENENHNDSFITIDDSNLPEKTDVILSKTYSPERFPKFLLGRLMPVFKIWEKELKDDATVEYKELSGRFYFMRKSLVNGSFIIGSKILNIQQNVTQIGFANFSRLRFSDVINNNYNSIASILDKAKTIDAYFYLTPLDIERFTFKNPIFVEQLSSYYLVNKIMNFVKGKITKCELIEVDRNSVLDIIVAPDPTFITIDSVITVGCNVTVNYSTDAPIGTIVSLNCQPNNFGFPPLTPPDPLYIFNSLILSTGVSNTTTFTLQAGSFYIARLSLQNSGMPFNLYSNEFAFDNTGSCEVPPAELTFITITGVKTLSQKNNIRRVEIFFNTDLQFPNTITLNKFDLSNFSLPETISVSNGSFEAEMPNSGPGIIAYGIIQWQINIQKNNIFSQTVDVTIAF